MAMLNLFGRKKPNKKAKKENCKDSSTVDTD